MTTFQELLETHAASSLEKQWALADVVGGLDWFWFIDLDKGTLDLGGRFELPIQVLGTEAEEDRTWLWAWANDISDIPANLLAAANSLKRLGDADGTRELRQAEISLGETNGTELAFVAVGVLGLPGFYGSPYEGGAAFVLLEEAPTKDQPRPDLVMMLNVFVEVISTLHVNHKRAFSAYASQKGFTIQPTATGLIARSAQRGILEADFDSLDRLVNIQIN